MAKDTEKSPAKKTGSEVAVPEAMAGAMLADAEQGGGYEGITADDLAIPFFDILQSGSPQCKGAGKIDGAEEGKLFNSVTQAVYEPGQRLIPCAYSKVYVEFVPRDSGGGFVKDHKSAGILENTEKDEKKRDVLTENGNHIVTTAQHFCLHLKEDGGFERVVIPMKATQLKKSRKWNTTQQSLQIVHKGKKFKAPIYSHSYQLATKPENNDQGEWSGWVILAPQVIVEPEVYAAAKQFHDEVVAGKVKTGEHAQSGETQDTRGDENKI